MGSSPHAVEFRRHLFEYRHDGSEWGIEILAASPEDAKQRLKALAWAHYKGEVALSIRVPGTPPWLLKLWSCFRRGIHSRQ